ncbi:MAG: iron ABC transporter ATP-binding protein [Planctomycetes bacterium]|nr:iron ABC transporter ATP-binding protein [Planctomycetota bacterium]
MTSIAAEMLSLQLGSRSVLDGVSFEVRPGELVLLAGRNGAGKSTVLRCLTGALRPDAGGAQLGGRPVLGWEPRARARELAFVPQDTDVPFDFTGRELVTMGRHPHRGRREALGPDDYAAIDRALSLVDATSFADRAVTTLSGGEQRRVAVARALATQSKLLLLDEPTNNLDIEHALQLVQLLRNLVDQGHGVLVASHDLNLFAPRCDRVMLLHDGRVHADAPPEQALRAANIAHVFGVRAAAPSGFFPQDFTL